MREVTNPVGKRLMIFGAGGAARAVEIVVVNRSRERRNVLVDLLNNRTPAKAVGRAWVR